MMVRRLLAIVNVALFVVAFFFEFLYPAYATLIFYGLLIWMVLSLFLFFGRSVDRPVGGGPTPNAAGSSAPLPSGPPASLDFCVYCGAPLSRGASACPVCGKAARPV
jgi:hypothetical protein